VLLRLGEGLAFLFVEWRITVKPIPVSTYWAGGSPVRSRPPALAQTGRWTPTILPAGFGSSWAGVCCSLTFRAPARLPSAPDASYHHGSRIISWNPIVSSAGTCCLLYSQEGSRFRC